MLTIHELVKWAKEELKTRIEEGDCNDENSVSDSISEIAESFVPVYTREILEVALSNFNFVSYESELWPAFWTSSPLNHIISNIYEYLSEELYERYNEYQTE